MEATGRQVVPSSSSATHIDNNNDYITLNDSLPHPGFTGREGGDQNLTPAIYDSLSSCLPVPAGDEKESATLGASYSSSESAEEGRITGETPAPGIHPPSFSCCGTPVEEDEGIFITNIKAIGLALCLEQMSLGMYAVIHHSGLEWRMENKHTHVLCDSITMELSGLVPIPSNPSETVRLAIYSSNDFQPMLSKQRSLRELTVTVERLLDQSAKDLAFIFSNRENGAVLPFSSLLVSVVRSEPEISHSLMSGTLDPHCSIAECCRQLKDAIYGTRGALSRLKREEREDVGRRIEKFEQALIKCPPNHPYRAAVPRNVAIARVIIYRVINVGISLDVPLMLCRNALSTHPIGDPDRPLALIHLAVLHLARFETQQNKADAIQAETLLREAVGLSSADSREKLAAVSFLRLHSGRKSNPVQEGASDHSYCAAVESNMEIAEAILRSVNNTGVSLDVALALYRNALSARPVGDPDRLVMFVSLAILHLASFEKRRDEADAVQAETLLCEAVGIGSVDSQAKWAAISMFRLCKERKATRVQSGNRFKSQQNPLSVGEDTWASSIQLLGRFEQLGDVAALQQAISLLEMLVKSTSARDPRYVIGVANLGAALLHRYHRSQEGSDLDQAISKFKVVIGFTPDGHPNKPGYMSNLGSSLLARFQRIGQLEDLDQAILTFGHAVDLAPRGHPQIPLTLNNFGNALFTRFERFEQTSDLEHAISRLGEAIGLIPLGHPLTPSCLESLGNSLRARFECLGKLGDLEQAISRLNDAIRLTPDGHPEKASRLNSLGKSLFARFRHSGKLCDLEFSVSRFDESVISTPNLHFQKVNRLNDLGIALKARFERLGKPHDLHRAISTLRSVVNLSSDGHPSELNFLVNLSSCLFVRFERLGELGDLDGAISMLCNAASALPNDHPHRPGFMRNLGSYYKARFDRLGEIRDLRRAILRLDEAVRLTPSTHRDKAGCLVSLGIAFLARFNRLVESSDLEQAISSFEEAFDLIPNDHPHKPTFLGNLGGAFLVRFEHFGKLEDLERAILTLGDAVELTPDDHLDKPSFLNQLGNAFSARFERFGETGDLERAISHERNAVKLTPDDHPHKPGFEMNLGSSLLTRFERLGSLGDLEQANLLLGNAAKLTPENHPDKAGRLSSLGHALFARFERFGELSDLERAIGYFRNALSLIPDDHPHKLSCLVRVGDSIFARYERLGHLSDLEEAIVTQKSAIKLTPDGHPDKSVYLNSLGSSLFARFERLGELDDLECAISRLKGAVHLTPNGHPDKSGHLSSLGSSLFARFERLGECSDLDNAISMLEEAADLVPDDHPRKPVYLANLGVSFKARFQRVGELSVLEQAISKLESAVNLIPDGHSGKAFHLLSLGNALFSRFECLGELSDLEGAISRLRDAVELTPDSHPQKPGYLNNLSNALSARFERLGELDDTRLAISSLENALDLTPRGHPDGPGRLSNLGNIFFARFRRLGELGDLERAISRQENAVDMTPDGHPDKARRLNCLGNSFLIRFQRTGCLSDLERAISLLMDAVNLTPDDHPRKPACLNNLGNALVSRFERNGELSDLEYAIRTFEEAVGRIPNNYPDRPAYLHNFADSLRIRSLYSEKLGDLERAILLYSCAASSTTGPAAVRFRASLSWILCARAIRHGTLIHAYSVALSILPELAWIGLSLSRRYTELMQGVDVVREAAAAALDAGYPETAVEWLEQGRSIVWGELLQLRSSYDELFAAYPDHARRLQQLSAQLEQAGITREKPSLDETKDATESLDQVAQRHRMLAIERDGLLREIRRLPGFERFLLHKEYSQLRSSAHSGPVVILNAAEDRCDALIVLADVERVVHVPLASFTAEQFTRLQTLLRGLSRDVPHGERVGKRILEEHTVEWESMLSGLWKCVVKPVLDSLAFVTPGKQPRIFWCPTGPFTFLPIHAAGYYDTQFSMPGHKVFDFVVSSYVPTLSALAPSPIPRVTPDSDLRLLVVRQPADDPYQLPGVDTELKHIRTVIGNSTPTRTTFLEPKTGTVEEVLDLMKGADWVHFACHGTQDGRNPTDSGLCLANQRRLKLSDIISLSRPRGGLAFLSACQTATGDEKLSDEAVHITAGMLFAGYGGVVGTMWSISDRAAPDVARDVYEQLFGTGVTPDYRGAARALQDAVGRLRDGGASFKVWIPFIHVGL